MTLSIADIVVAVEDGSSPPHNIYTVLPGNTV
jgi:hypothetical protein